MPPKSDIKGRYWIQGTWMYIDDRDSLGLKKYGIYEQEETKLWKELIKNDSIVLDIGANIGYFTLIMSKLARQVHAFEPDPRNFQILQNNIEANNIKNVKLYHSAAAETAGSSTLYLSEINRGMHRLYRSDWCKEGSVQVQTVRIDDIIDQSDFVKIDVEGAELGVLKGMKQLLEKSKPTVIMEFDRASIMEYGAKPKDIYDFMASLGYAILTLKGQTLSFNELETKLAAKEISKNILCRTIHSTS
jgi:FkbM family methyltransferase